MVLETPRGDGDWGGGYLVDGSIRKTEPNIKRNYDKR